MDSVKENELYKFIIKMRDSTDYLSINDLKDQHSYKIYARNAYVGVWVKSKNAFLISRSKGDSCPYLFFEFHWDTGDPYGTVKPLALIEKYPFEVKQDYSDKETEEILQYLEKLAANNPLIEECGALLES